MKAASKFLLLSLALVSNSCKDEKTVAEDDLHFRLQNLENAGWKSKNITQRIDDISYGATEVPIQYYLLKEIGSDKPMVIDSLYRVNKSERVFEVVFSQDDMKDLLSEEFTHMDYQSAAKYLSFNIQEDFYAVTNKNDTVR